MLHKGKRFIIILLCFINVFAFSCAKPKSTEEDKKEQEITCDYQVDFIDVGEGDSIFIKFPDGKTMLIDCGEKGENNYQKIADCVSQSGADKIDYFVITHPDADHAGNALEIIQNFEIGLAFIPDIIVSQLIFYQNYSEFYQTLIEKQIDKKISSFYSYIKEEDYCVIFLTPTPRAVAGSEYTEFNRSESPTESQSNSLSPIIYIEICGVRFVLTGDAPEKQEKKALENLKLAVIKRNHEENGLCVNLENIDFLKVSHHGSADASCEEFLNVLAPKNAIISVGANNYYGHPSTQVLQRLERANNEYTLYRTDVCGTISVKGYGKQVKVAVEIG
jgi:competence protein ComEC